MSADEWRIGDRYDRTGELPVAHECDGGWIDRDADHPIPCSTCRPHLAAGRLNRAARDHRTGGTP